MRRTVARGGRARLAALALTGALALSTTGCSLLGGGGGDDGNGGKSAEAVPTVAVDGQGRVKGAIATVNRLYQGYKIQVDVLALTRYDKATRLEFAVTPRSSGATDPLDKDAFANGFGDKSVSAVRLIDTKNLKQYAPMDVGTGDDPNCACSHDLDDYALDKPTVLYADFPAVPDSVHKLTVLVPKVGPIAGVRVS